MKLKAKHYRSKALRSLHEVAVDLCSVGAASVDDVARLDKRCLTRKGRKRLAKMKANK